MSIMTHPERPTLLARVCDWWKRWRERRGSLGELELLDNSEIERVARDAGVSTGDLRVLAGKWPGSADLLTRRMTAVGLDAGKTERGDPAVMRDLQRVCSLCANKRGCEHDLDRDPTDRTWQTYCPNVETLGALSDQSSTNADRKGS